MNEQIQKDIDKWSEEDGQEQDEIKQFIKNLQKKQEELDNKVNQLGNIFIINICFTFVWSKTQQK